MNRISFFSAAVSFSLGVALSGALGPLAAAALPPLFLAVVAAAALGSRHRRLALLIVFALLGVSRSAFDRADFAASRATLPDEARWFSGMVVGLPSSSNRSQRFTLDVAGRRFLVVVLATGTTAAPAVLAGDSVAVFARPAVGSRLRGPGIRDESERLRAHGHRARLVVGGDRVRVLGRGAAGLARQMTTWQRALAAAVARRGGDADGNAVVRALTSGDRSGIGGELAARLRRAGIGHVLAVSGLHLAVVSVLLFALVRRAWACVPALANRLEPATAAAIVAIAAASGYVMVTGARPSALRAWLAAAVILAGVAVFRRARPLDALGIAALVLLAWRPAMLTDASFQMSFAAATVLCMARVGARAADDARPVASRLARLGRAALSLASVSTWALAATAPTASGLFGEIAPIGIAVNVVALPLVELLILPLALVGVLVSTVVPFIGSPLGGLLIDLAIVGAGVVVDLASLASRLDPVSIAPFGPFELVGTMLAIAAVLAWRHGRGAGWLVIAVVVAALVIGSARRGPTAPDGVRVTFLDVGQGDATLVEFATGAVWLIDAGGRPSFGARDARRAESPGRIAVLGVLRARRIHHIDVVVISHAHPDHYLGLGAVGAEISIGALWLAPGTRDQPLPRSLDALIRWLRVLGTDVRSPPREIAVGDARIRVLAPLDPDGRVAVDPVSSVNDNSLVLRLDLGRRSVLFAGDLEEEGESLLLESAASDLDVDVVKVNHHGSKTSSSSGWVRATSASIAVASCGRRNRFGFPARVVLERWQRAGTRLLRTDLDGAVTMHLMPGGEIAVTTTTRW